MKLNYKSSIFIVAWVMGIAALFFLAIYTPLRSFPSEDAAMLFQYSQNLAETGVISYNAAQPPAEGATDFFWMVLIAGAVKMGMASFLAANVLSALALVGSVWILSRLSGGGRFALSVSYMVVLILLPPYFAAVQGFSPYFFGFSILLSAFFFINRCTIPLSLSLLITCMIRPDGIVFALPLSLIYIVDSRYEWRNRLILFVLFTGLPGGLYFIWRWHYFGYFLPLPFYVKSHFDRFWLVFNKEALFTNLRYILAGLPLFVISAIVMIRSGDKKARKDTWAILIALLGVPFLFYSCMHLEQNIAYRFQYPFCLAAIVMAALAAGRLKQKRWLVLGGAFMIVWLAPMYAVEGYRTLCIPAENVPYISMELGQLNGRGKIATTEAGRLPYYSQWNTVDLWGLNTPEFSQRVVSVEDVKAYNPDLIVLHTSGDYYGDDWRFLGSSNLVQHTERNWSNMVENTYIAAQQEGYELWMIPHRYVAASNSLHGKFAQIRPVMKKKLGYKGSFETYYAFLINPASPHRSSLSELLLQHGAITYPRYRKLKEAFVNE